MFPDSVIAQGLEMKRTKCTEIAKNLGTCMTNDLFEKLKSNLFSIIIDESTDVTASKFLTIIVKYFDFKNCTIKTRMLDLIDIYEGNAENVGSSGEVLFKKLIEILEAHQIPLSNFIGFAADGASNVMGAFDSLSSRLKETLPGITIFKCICHSINLCSSEAAKTLPRQCEDFIRNV
ncbi:uncharacterized protein LOC135207687 [Macrobrachium nipponense]|uniref:uncharacterized protein LOC135207687 n=1 Tax=Macrobrachium nipponense TaxID=159736 RepID=UPI0030C811A5